jgi:hypothetical protein
MNNTAIFDGTADKWESLYDRCSMQTSHSLETCYWLFLAVMQSFALRPLC